MCNNVFKWFLRAFAVVAALTVTSCADSPDEDDIVIPQLSLSIDGTTVEQGSVAMMTFDETGGTKQFSIQTTGEWEISGLENAPQSFALTTSQGEEKYTGKGDETFTVTLGEATTASRFSMAIKAYASIFGQKKVSDTKTITVVQTKGGVLPVGKVIYNNNFDKEEATQTFGSGTSWPFLDQFEGWKNHEGEGAAEVTYDFKSVSARANSKSDGSYSNYAGSGSNNLLFGGSGYLTIQNIAVSTTNLQLTFGTERYAYGENDNTFKNEEFLVTLSADGQSWSAPIAYAFPEGNDTNGKWNLATADFTLPDGTTKLYIKFATKLSGAHRVDDVKLTDGIGGQAITFDGGGDEPTPPTPSEAIYSNNFDKETATKTHGTSGSSWPYIDQFEGWKNETGTGATAVTYEGSGVSVRANSESNGSYSNYAGSGANNIFFGTNGTLTICNIALPSNKLCLTFGTERYINGQDNTFKNEEFLVTLSADGKAWSKPIAYAFEAGKDTNGKWNVATADFTLPESVKTLYIKFVSTLASAHRIDDVTLTGGNGGQEITFEGGGDEPTPPTPGESGTIKMSAADMIANGTTTIPENSYGSQNVNDASTYYTWKMNGVTFAGAKICKATNEDYAGLIQMQGSASDKAKQGFFGNADDLKKITKVVIVSKNTKYEPTEHLYVGTSAYPLGQNAVTRADLKQEGQTYTETFNVSGNYGYFAVANDKQGAFYVESVTVYYGGEGGDEPTPSTPGTMTVAELVAKCKAAGSTQTVLDADKDVVVEAVVVTDKDGGNTNAKNLAIMAEGATEAGNGVLLYGSGITDPADDSYTWKSGDKVKVTLKAGQARACIYNGTYEITGSASADWVAIEKIGTATVTPVELTTVDKLAEYQSMVVKVKDATSPAKAAEWCTADAYKTHKFTVGGSDLTVYVQKNAAAFVGKQFKASTKGDITGVVTVYKNNPQLAPRTADDVKAFSSEGGDAPTPSTPSTMTVADLVAKCKAAGSTQTVLDADKDVEVEAVVVTDKDGGNTNAKNLAIMAEGATAAGNGVLLYGSGITDPTHESYTWKAGDKIKVTLKAGQARACIFNGTYEITGSADAEWIAIEKIGTATVTPVELTTVDKLLEYQSMAVKVKDATSPATAAEWCTADSYKTHKFTVGGSDLTVYVQKNAAAFVGKQFKASAKGDITGVVTVYKSNPQLAPRTADDVKAFSSEGGDAPTPSTPSTMTVADLVAKCKAAGSTQTVLDADKDVEVEAVVVTDKDGGNTNAKNLAIMAEGATAAGNGVLLYGSGITDPADDSYTWKSGDKVKVTLKAGQARACIYNGTYEITGSADAEWVAIEKIGTATVTPVELTTVDKLVEYQSMAVKVKDATSPATAAEWCTADAYKTHKFTVGGSDLTVYVQKNAAAFVGKQFKASAKGDITGVVTLYNSNPQLAPRTADDVKAFNDDGSQPGGGDEPQPGKDGVATYVPSQMGYANAEKVSSATLNDGAVTLAFAGGGTATAYYDSGTSLRCYANSTITVKSGAKISKIVVTRGANDKGNTLTASVGTLSEDTLTWTGESNEVVLTVSGTSGHIRIASMEITYGEGGGNGGDQPGQPDQPDQPTTGNTASLTLDDIAKSGPRSYQDFSITAADGSVWTGFCSGTAARLQMGWNTDTSKSASKSYVLVPNADKVIKKITFTPEAGTTDNRVLAILPEDFKYTGQSADEVKAAALACSANTVKGSTEPLSVDLTGKNLKRFIIRAVGGAVYLTNITIEYAE